MRNDTDKQGDIDRLKTRIKFAQRQINTIAESMKRPPLPNPLELDYSPGGNENIYFTDSAGNSYFFKGGPGELDNEQECAK